MNVFSCHITDPTPNAAKILRLISFAVVKLRKFWRKVMVVPRLLVTKLVYRTYSDFRMTSTILSFDPYNACCCRHAAAQKAAIFTISVHHPLFNIRSFFV